MPTFKKDADITMKSSKKSEKSDQLVSVLQHWEKRKKFFFSYFVLGALVGMIKRLLREMKKYIFKIGTL